MEKKPGKFEIGVKTLLSSLDASEVLDLANTPARVARMWEELLSGTKEASLTSLKETMRTFPSQGKHEMVVLSEITFYSICAHHLIPFFGTVAVGYIPNERVVGLSKVPRVVDHFSKQPQTQERLTSSIADFLEKELSPKAVLVLSEARHLCVEMRGVRKPGVVTRVAALRGLGHEDHVKNEFYLQIRK